MGLFDSLGNFFSGQNAITPPRVGAKVGEQGIQLGNFELCIPQGVHLQSGHVRLEHNTHYSLLMKNHSHLDCDAEVRIDGTFVGTWRVRKNTSVEIERPADDTGRFTFYKLGTAQARKIGLSANDNLGLVTVIFMSEKPPAPPAHTVSDSGVKFSPRRGGTGLAGESTQRFNSVAPLDYDRSNFTTINLRLFCDDGEPRPLGRSSTRVPSPLPK